MPFRLYDCGCYLCSKLDQSVSAYHFNWRDSGVYFGNDSLPAHKAVRLACGEDARTLA
jgi:hypothetical protein